MGIQTHIKVSGAWKTVKNIYVNVGGAWKTVMRGHTRVAGSWKLFHEVIPVPQGLILMYNDQPSNLPAGWTQWTGAQQKFIVGAGNTWNPGQNSLANPNPLVWSGSEAGSHLGVSANFLQHGSRTGGQTYFYSFDEAAGAHVVTASTPSPLPPYADIFLIKAGAGVLKIPENGVFFGVQNFTGFTNGPHTNARWLRGGAAINTYPGQMSLSTTTTGTPTHLHSQYPSNGYDRQADNYINRLWNWYAGGDTGHGVSINFQYRLQSFYLSMWTKAAEEFDIQSNMIGMYESLTPPAGWALCDGTNGTPDLRDYFILCGDNTEHGVTNGLTGYKLYGSGTSNTLGTHNHWPGNTTQEASQYPMYHLEDIGGHNHTFGEEISWLPNYYALAFIQYKG